MDVFGEELSMCKLMHLAVMDRANALSSGRGHFIVNRDAITFLNTFVCSR